jgi:hypothetical protein
LTAGAGGGGLDGDEVGGEGVAGELEEGGGVVDAIGGALSGGGWGRGHGVGCRECIAGGGRRRTLSCLLLLLCWGW